ncbi:unnamed protein product [Arabis nemorensis]|uniref:Uncharacterized protein n=1 Tax=Arabis nemorensis TaxID=586526 RepID=A0A565AUI3_9BRAS|nr:unnamed protein product [Arabis nemorensis]
MEVVGTGFTIYKTIDVSGNRLQGDIPESISLLKELIVLNMSNNAFTGHIPPSLPNLTNLQSLDLSQNEEEEEIAAAIGYVPGVFCGLTIGHILSSHKHEWFMKIFHSST